jgi:hypothetical protein
MSILIKAPRNAAASLAGEAEQHPRDFYDRLTPLFLTAMLSVMGALVATLIFAALGLDPHLMFAVMALAGIIAMVSIVKAFRLKD